MDASTGISSEVTTTEGTDNAAPETAAEQQLKGQKAPEEPWRKAKHKYKAAGKEYEVDYDELVKRAEKSHGADERFRQASEKEKEILEVKKKLEKIKDPSQEDWEELIDLIGWDKAQKFADNLVWNQIKWKELSKEQQEAIQAKYEADAAKSELQRIKERDAQREAEAQRQQSMQIIQNEIDAVLEIGRKEGLPAADIPEIQEMIIDEMIAYLEAAEAAENQGKRMPAPPSHEDVLRRIQDRYSERSDTYIKRLSVDGLKKLLTKEQLEGLRQAEIDQLYASTPKSGTTSQKAADDFDPFQRRERPKNKNRVMRTDDFFSQMDQKFGR